MRRVGPPAVALAVALLALAPGGASAATCSVPAGHSLVAGSGETLVTATRLRPGELGVRRWVACLRATGRRTVLAAAYHGDDASVEVRAFVFAGDWVAYEVRMFDRYYGSSDFLTLADVRTGFVREVAAAASPRDISAVALDPGGRAAWFTDGGDERRVHGVVAGGLRELDRGPRAAIDALSVADGRIRWTRDGAERSVEAPVRCRAQAPELPVARSTAAVVLSDGRRLRGCLTADERSVALTARPASLLTIATTQVAFVERTGAARRVALVDVRTGVRWSGDAVRSRAHRVTLLIVDRRGRAAWVRARGRRRVLFVRDTRGRVHVADRRLHRAAGPHFAFGELRWTEGEQLRLRRVP